MKKEKGKIQKLEMVQEGISFIIEGEYNLDLTSMTSSNAEIETYSDCEHPPSIMDLMNKINELIDVINELQK